MIPKNAAHPLMISFARLRVRLMICLLLTTVLGCGDCAITPSDFVDVVGADFGFPNDTGDAGEVDLGGGDADMGSRPPNDMRFQFDFPPIDQSPDAFELTAVVPNSGPVKGDTRVRILGTGLSDGSEVFFGSVAVGSSLDDGDLVVRTPEASGPGLVPVKVVAPDGQIRVIADGYRYARKLRLDSVTPSRIPVAGEVEVELRGSGFEKPAAVSFGDIQALRVEVIDDTLIRAIAPAHDRGTVGVRVTTADDSSIIEDAVAYYQPLRIISVTPASGITAGGETITLELEGLLEQPRIWLGGQEATVTNANLVSGLVQVATPAQGPGVVNVFAESQSDATVLENGFWYRANDSPAIVAIAPSLGPESGGNEVHILGWKLNDATAEVQFGGVASQRVNANSARATVMAPAGTGMVDVTLHISGTEVGRLAAAYTFVADLSLGGATPTSGTTDGGETVTLTGAGFIGAERIVIGGVPVDFVVVSDTQITFTTPTHSAGTASIVVYRDGLEATLKDAFVFDEPLEIWGFNPVRGAMAGGTYVEMRGRGFFGELEVFLDQMPAVSVRRIDRNNLTFSTPPHLPGEALVSLETGGNKALAPFGFHYFDPASRFGGASGGTVEGSVNVTVFSLGGGPIEEAFVMLSTREDTPYQGFTNTNGMITLSGPDVLGAQTITATAAGYSTATIQALDAENITIFLNLLDPQGQPGNGQPPPRGSIHGSIRATGKLSDPDDERTYDLAIVETTQRTAGSFNPPPGQGSVVLGEGQYDIVTRIGDMALVGLCGEFNEVTQVFTPKLMAVKRFIFMSDQDRLEYDLECNIPLDAELSFKLVNTAYAPLGPNNNRVRVFWDFGFEGTFTSPVVGESLTNIVTVSNQPQAEGVLSDLRFIAEGGSYTFEGGSPFTRTKLSGISDTSMRLQMPNLLDVAEPSSPGRGGQIVNNTLVFQASGPYFPDFWYITIRNDLGIPVYMWLIPGDQNMAVVPDFPDFSSLPPAIRPSPLIQQTLFMTIVGARVSGGHLYDQFTYLDLESESWEATSVASWAVRLPAPN